MSNGVSPARELEVPRAAGIIGHQVEECEKCLASLTDRLCHVMRSTEPKVQDASNKEIRGSVRVGTPLSDELSSYACRLSSCVTQMQDLLNRLEV